MKARHLAYLIAILGVNSLYFILTDSASLHGIQLVNLRIWVFLLLLATIYPLVEVLLGGLNTSHHKLLRFSVVLSWFSSIFHVLGMSGNSPLVVNVVAASVALFAFLRWMMAESSLTPQWILFVGYLGSMNFSAMAGSLFLADGIVITSFFVGEFLFICGMVVAIVKANLSRTNLGIVLGSGVIGGLVMYVALSNDVMFLVLNLIMTRVLGIAGFQGIPYASYFSVLLFFQFVSVAALLLVQKRYFLVALGLTGVGISYAPVLFIRNFLLFQYATRRV